MAKAIIRGSEGNDGLIGERRVDSPSLNTSTVSRISFLISLLTTTTKLIMNCYVCNIPLIWGGDEDIDEEEGLEHKIVTNLSCQQCGSIVHVYHGK